MTSKKTITVRIVKWTGIVLAVLITLVLLGTWAVNTETVQKKVRAAVTRRTNNILKFDQLKLALFPRPHLTIDGITVGVPGRVSGAVSAAVIYPELLPLFAGSVSVGEVLLDDPEFTVKLVEQPGAGAENARAAFAETREGIRSAITSVRGIAPDLLIEVFKGKFTVAIDGRILSQFDDINGTVALLRRGFDLGLRAQSPRWGRVSIKGALLVWRHAVSARNLSLSGARSSFSEVNARFSWRKTPYLDIRSGRGVIALEDIYERKELFGYLGEKLRNAKKISGTLRLAEMNFVGPLLHENQWKMQAAGTVEKISIDSLSLAGAVRIGQGRFLATTDTLILTNAKADIMGSSVSGAMSFVGPYRHPRSLAVFVQSGRIGQKTLDWASKKFNVPPEFAVNAPVWLSRLYFTWENAGHVISAAASAALNKGPRLSLDITSRPGSLLVRRLMIQDESVKAVLTARSTAKSLDLTFAGKLTEETLKRIFERMTFNRGWIAGDFRAHIAYENSGASTAQGRLEGVDLSVPWTTGPPLAIKRAVLEARNKSLRVRKASFLWEGTPFDLTGGIKAAREGFLVDMDLDAGSVSIDSLRRAYSYRKKETATGESVSLKKSSKRVPVMGEIRFAAKNFTYGRYVLTPFTGNIFLDRNSIRVEIIDAKICGVSLPGHWQPFDGRVLLDMEPAARGQELEPALTCFSPKNHITGKFDFSGKLHALAERGEIVRSLHGQVSFTATDGKIYRYPIFARIFAFLNLTELLRGKLPDLGRDGFKYKTIKIRGDIRGGKLVLRQAAVEGSTLNIAAEGEVDFASNKINVTVLVAPFKTIEYILSRIPLLRNILANKLVTIPVRVSGDLNNPTVTPLDPKAIGKNVLDIMKGILELPFRIIEPLF